MKKLLFTLIFGSLIGNTILDIYSQPSSKALPERKIADEAREKARKKGKMSDSLQAAKRLRKGQTVRGANINYQ